MEKLAETIEFLKRLAVVIKNPDTKLSTDEVDNLKDAVDTLNKAFMDRMKAPFTDNTLMPFGKHRGTPLKDVPAGWLDWFMDQDWAEEKWPRLVEYCNGNIHAIEQELDEKSRDDFFSAAGF